MMSVLLRTFVGINMPRQVPSVCRLFLVVVFATGLVCPCTQLGAANPAPGKSGVASPALHLQLTVDGTGLTGQLWGHDRHDCWLVEPTGRLHQFPMRDVTQYEQLSKPFQPLGLMPMRDLLQREFPGREVAASGQYVVVAQPGRAASHARFFDQLQRDFEVTLRARSLRLQPMRFPLVAVVCSSRDEFVEYCERDGFSPSSLVAGFYLPSSNRVALYEETATDSEGVRDTVVHEAFHQVAFNFGVHQRVGDNPRWLVEGLATTFEPELFRSTMPGLAPSDRVNRERYLSFLARLGQRKSGWLLELISSDDVFRRRPLDAYADAWGVTFWLMETQGSEFTAYLQALSRLGVADAPADAEAQMAARKKLFEKHFRSDWTLNEAHLERYFANLGSRP